MDNYYFSGNPVNPGMIYSGSVKFTLSGWGDPYSLNFSRDNSGLLSNRYIMVYLVLNHRVRYETQGEQEHSVLLLSRMEAMVVPTIINNPIGTWIWIKCKYPPPLNGKK
ncbi:MAG TPA: hypothetical protein VLB84_00145 [Bacteroidia bacterium]|nr:hypothetical protein [Bacteroidia bacterium]